jgi:hypothetical protein
VRSSTRLPSLQVWLGVTPSYTVPHIEPPRIVQRFKQMALARNITWWVWQVADQSP